MNDLISRESVIETLKQTGIITDNDLGHLVVEEIERIPIAYDVDKVVRELEKENERLKTLKNNCIALCDHEVIGIENKAYNYAIEIVKRGGKEE